jgi:hypothetical protein
MSAAQRLRSRRQTRRQLIAARYSGLPAFVLVTLDTRAYPAFTTIVVFPFRLRGNQSSTVPHFSYLQIPREGAVPRHYDCSVSP